MTTTRMPLLSLGLVALIAAPAAAQRGPGMMMGMGGGGAVQLLMAPPVQEELALSDEQVEQVTTLAEDFREQMRTRMQEARAELQQLSQQERFERFEAMVREMDAEAREQLREVLKPEQLHRLMQIRLQQAGVMALGEPPVRERLKLSDEQSKKIDEILASFRSDLQSMMQEARQQQTPPDPEKFLELRRKHREEALAVLTDEQKASLEELQGEPFELPPPPGPGGPRRGAPPRP